MKAKRVVYLSGGVGGARLLEGLARALPGACLTAIVNVGDDFEHWGLTICPDIDTVLYTLGGKADLTRGWGLHDETFRALHHMRLYGSDDWFQIGDADLAMHVMRSEHLRQGHTLTQITRDVARALGVAVDVLPMSNDRLRTRIDTRSEGTLAFQDWLVRRGGVPEVAAVRFEGNAAPTPEALAAIEAADFVVIGPSNPYVSIDPILSLGPLREAVSRKPVVAVSPIIAGRAIKGPLANMIQSLAQRSPSAGAIAAHYGDLLAGIVVESGDEASVQRVRALGTATIMRSADERLQLARAVLAFAEQLSAL